MGSRDYNYHGSAMEWNGMGVLLVELLVWYGMVWFGMVWNGSLLRGKEGCSDVDVIAVEESITRWPAPHRSFWCGIQRVKEPREALGDGGGGGDDRVFKLRDVMKWKLSCSIATAI